MVAAIGPVAATFWWLGLAVVVLVVVPAIALLAWRLIQTVAEIRRYADDIRTHGVGLADELEAVAELRRTRDLAASLREGLTPYATAVGRITGSGESR